jgi:hypothetical protein
VVPQSEGPLSPPAVLAAPRDGVPRLGELRQEIRGREEPRQEVLRVAALAVAAGVVDNQGMAREVSAAAKVAEEPR